MLYDYQKLQALEDARKRDELKDARETLKKYSLGKNKGKAKDTIHQAKSLAEAITPWGALSLLFQGSLSDWMYWMAIFAALLKDLLDLVLIGSFPGFGTIITLCISIFIATMMLLGSIMTGHGFAEQKIIHSWLKLAPNKQVRSLLILLFGAASEMLFGLNFLPIETLTVLFIYGFVLAERKQAKEEERNKQEIRIARRSYA